MNQWNWLTQLKNWQKNKNWWWTISSVWMLIYTFVIRSSNVLMRSSALILWSFSALKCSHFALNFYEKFLRLADKIFSDIRNSLKLEIFGIQNLLILFFRSIMLYTPMEHSVILQKMTDTNDIQTQMISFLSRFSIYIYICIYIYIYICI